MVKRKLDGAVDRSSVIKIFVNWTRIYTTCENFEGLHLAEPDLTAGWLINEVWARLEILKACCKSKYLIFCIV